MRIAVLDDYAGVARGLADWDRLGGEITFHRAPLADPARDLAGAEIVCLMRERTPFPAELIAALPALRLIVTTGPRNLSIDLDAARARGIEVCGTRSRKTTTSELTLALLLALSRRILPEAAALAAGGWQGLPGRDLAGLRLGLVGLGNIGTQMAGLGRALGMQVAAWSPNLTAQRAEAQQVARAASLSDLAAGSDVLSTHMVLSERTAGLIGAETFAALPEGAIFLNTSRAGLVDRDALLAGLRAGRPAMAGIDVFESEPLAAGDPWRQAVAEFGPRLLLTPHLGYVTEATWRLFYEDTVAAIAAWQAGAPIRRL
ncbi:D-2-hydroxyacid dehydrogenase family protein [Mangrovicoccus algicola]|uniref:D-2-hydroxyacid dehydrogenase family protein n=1 Tax=Mangrovicoccus algicola TaxID=2771008 RepID=A0A8J6YTN1_9RHOB|nr:D-2-hydroxyacid dehydrogenase family protein [Mangrovicoccus algicola]MBE3637607.1 D-2-hydroxyacid dehydrogenase family protein [Mangrovicoccus algicola]